MSTKAFNLLAIVVSLLVTNWAASVTAQEASSIFQQVMDCVSSEDVPCVEKLIQDNPNFNPYNENIYGFSPIFRAVCKNNANLVSALLAGKPDGDPSFALDPRLQTLTALQDAALCDASDVTVWILKDTRINPNQTSGPTNQSAVHYAIGQLSMSVFDILLQDTRIDFKQKDLLGNNYLHYAVGLPKDNMGDEETSNRRHMIKKLTDKGLNPQEKNEQGISAYSMNPDLFN